MELTDAGDLRGGWSMRSLASVCTKISSGGTPSRRNPDFYVSTGTPWVKTQELVDGWIDDTEEHISTEAMARCSAKLLPTETVLMAMYGATVGQLAMLRRPMACNQACIALQVDPEVADFRFVYYSLLAYRDVIKSAAVGAAQQNISGVMVKSMELPFPPLAEQRRIAHILGTLDDKIELNRRMSETLEEMARALFKSWFVDFDPVRAKAEGRDTGLPPHIADLFPSRLVDSELGAIPEGWQWLSLPDVAQLLNGLALQKYPTDPDEPSLPVIKIAQLRSLATDGADRASLRVPDDYLVHDGDLLFSWSGSLLVDYWTGETGALNQHLFKVTPRGNISLPFVRQGLLMHLEHFRDIAAHKATTMGHIKRGDLDAAHVAVPPVFGLPCLCGPLDSLDARLLSARSQTRTLTESRDNLLRGLLG